MMIAKFRSASTQQGLSDEPDSNVGELSLTTTTFSKKDRILETSLSTKRRLRADIRQAQDAQTVQDLPRAHVLTDEEPALDDRARLLLALLLRPEALDFLKGVVEVDDPALQRDRLGVLVLSSDDALYCVSRLATEGAVTVTDGRLKLTDLAVRVLNLISSARV